MWSAACCALKSKYIVAALSNGNMSLLTNMAKHAGIPWDCILSAELARHYKPDREVYETAAHLLDLGAAFNPDGRGASPRLRGG